MASATPSPRYAQATVSSTLKRTSASKQLVETQQVVYFSRSTHNGITVLTPVYTPKVSNKAAKTVFGTYELLEAILLQLPVRKIIAVRAVSRIWRNMLHSSLALKRRTFLAKIPCALPKVDAGFVSTMPPTQTATHFRANPLFNHMELDYQSPILLPPWRYCRFDASWRADDRPYDQYMFFRIPLDAFRAGALGMGIWGSMYLTKPPCAALVAYIGDGGELGNRYGVTIRDRDGINLGSLADALKPVIEQYLEFPNEGEDILGFKLQSLTSPGFTLAFRRLPETATG